MPSPSQLAAAVKALGGNPIPPNLLPPGFNPYDPGESRPDDFRCAHPLDAPEPDAAAQPKTLSEKLDETNDLLREILRQLGGKPPQRAAKTEYEGVAPKKDSVVLPDDDIPGGSALG